MKIIKKDICKKVYEKCFLNSVLPAGVTKEKLQYVVDAFLDTIVEELLEGNSIELRGLGTFERTLQKARYYAINPKTGKEVETKNYYKASFHPGKKLKEQMKQIPVPESEIPKPSRPVITSPHWEPDLETLSEYSKRYKQMHK